MDINTSSYLTSAAYTDNYATEALQKKLGNTDITEADDAELMEACESFEAYFVEQVLKEAKKTVKSEEDEGEYMKMFGDTLLQEYATALTKSGQIGLAKTLYDSMKVQTTNPVTLTQAE